MIRLTGPLSPCCTTQREILVKGVDWSHVRRRAQTDAVLMPCCMQRHGEELSFPWSESCRLFAAEPLTRKDRKRRLDWDNLCPSRFFGLWRCFESRLGLSPKCEPKLPLGHFMLKVWPPKGLPSSPHNNFMSAPTVGLRSGRSTGPLLCEIYDDPVADNSLETHKDLIADNPIETECRIPGRMLKREDLHASTEGRAFATAPGNGSRHVLVGDWVSLATALMDPWDISVRRVGTKKPSPPPMLHAFCTPSWDVF